MKPQKYILFSQFESKQLWQGEWAPIIRQVIGTIHGETVTFTETTEKMIYSL